MISHVYKVKIEILAGKAASYLCAYEQFEHKHKCK